MSDTKNDLPTLYAEQKTDQVTGDVVYRMSLEAEDGFVAYVPESRLTAAEETIARLTEALAASEARVAALDAAVKTAHNDIAPAWSVDPNRNWLGRPLNTLQDALSGGTSALEAHVACEIKPLAIRIAELEVALIELVQPNPKNDAVIRGIEALGGEQPAHIAYVAHEIREMENAVESALESAISGDEEMPEAAGCWAIGQSVFNRIHDTLDQRVARAVEAATKPLVALLTELSDALDTEDACDVDDLIRACDYSKKKIDAALAGAKGTP